MKYKGFNKVIRISLSVLLLMAFVWLFAGTYRQAAYGAEYAQWEENNASIYIFGPKVLDDGYYHIYYSIGSFGNAEELLVPSTQSIDLLMVNGGFVLDAEIIKDRGIILIPLRRIAEITGKKVSWDSDSQSIRITDASNYIEIKVNKETAQVNNGEYTLNIPVKIVNSITYVPMEFISEILNYDVQYHPNFFLDALNIIAVETENNTIPIPVEEARDKVILESQKHFEKLIAYLQSQHAVFGERYRKYYDPEDIIHSRKNLGRYYVFALKEFEEYPILFNKYLGEIYGGATGLPVFGLSKGFPHISFLYQ